MENDYKNREWLKKKWVDERMTTAQIAEKFDVWPKSVWYWVDKYDLQRYRRPWECEQLMHYLYTTKDYTLQDICEELNGTPPTVLQNLHDFDIDMNDAHPEKPKCHFFRDANGYNRIKGIDSEVYAHQLVAIGWGADPHEVFSDDTAVHHINGVKFDNRPENLKVMDSNEHISIHTKGESNPDSKLTKEQVKEIRKQYERTDKTQTDLANKYEISQAQISTIVRGDAWEDV